MARRIGSKRLSTQQGKVIRGVFKSKELYQGEIAHLIGLANTTFSTKMVGTNPFSPEEAEALYKALDRDPSLEFLHTFSLEGEPKLRPRSTGGMELLVERALAGELPQPTQSYEPIQLDGSLASYVSTIVRYAQDMTQTQTSVSILDFESRGSVVSRALTEQLTAGGVDFNMLVFKGDLYSLYKTWNSMSHLVEGGNVSFLHRLSSDLNTPIGIDSSALLRDSFEKYGPHSKNPDEERFINYNTVAGLEMAGVPFIDRNWHIADGSIDLLVGHSPFSFIGETVSGGIRTAIEATARYLLKPEGYSVFTTAFNDPADHQAATSPVALGVSHKGLDPLFRATGLQLQGEPERHTYEGFSPFHFGEVVAYKKTG